MNEKLNIETCTTAAESLFSNGTVEYHNLIEDEAMEKTYEKCEPEIPLAWAVSGKMLFKIVWGIIQMSLCLAFVF